MRYSGLVFFFLAAVFLLDSAHAVNLCGGNCLSSECPECPCGYYTYYQTEGSILDTLETAGFNASAASIMFCIMTKESGLDAYASYYNDDTTYNTGLALINDVNLQFCGLGYREQLCVPQVNANCAYAIANQYGWHSWGDDGFGCADLVSKAN